jgi:hypothetical protein
MSTMATFEEPPPDPPITIKYTDFVDIMLEMANT